MQCGVKGESPSHRFGEKLCGRNSGVASSSVAFLDEETLTFQEEIYSSSYAAAAYLESINFKKKVCVLPCPPLPTPLRMAMPIKDLLLGPPSEQYIRRSDRLGAPPTSMSL